MIQIDIKSPDRVNVLLLLDELTAGTVSEQCTGPSSYSVWCIGVDDQLLRKRLEKVCHHPFKLSDGSPESRSVGGGHFGTMTLEA